MLLGTKKETRVKFNPRLSANRPSNWALDDNLHWCRVCLSFLFKYFIFVVNYARAFAVSWLNASLKYRVLNFAASLMISGDCSKSWRMHWKRLHRQAFFSIVVNGLPTGYWCSSGGCMSKSSCWRPCFFDTWPMNALETEHSNLEIDSKLNQQPVKT